MSDESEKSSTHQHALTLEMQRQWQQQIQTLKSTQLLRFVIDMPDLKSGDIKVSLEEDNVLVVTVFEKREEEKQGAKYPRMERRIGKFTRKFALPIMDTEKIFSIACRDGVLNVIIEKVPPPRKTKKPKTIEVKIA
ncbi:hypothetical protein IFM89_014230 [Coptis chinensis]|uniref:SHSP domain-containing protein n=1 Tax=Coptis chinensis TaxID=261450 RepID=A0A835H5U5_9MAGN|nr:hypothetical protein IFM89_014230 [Coptis chinensis]